MNADAMAELNTANQLFIPEPFAACRDVTGHVDDAESAFRIYGSSPSGTTVQVRAFGPTAYSGKGAKRMMVASVSLDHSELRQLRDFCNARLLAVGEVPA